MWRRSRPDANIRPFCLLLSGEDWSRQRVVMVGRRGFQRRAFLSLSGHRCKDMLTDPHRVPPHRVPQAERSTLIL